MVSETAPTGLSTQTSSSAVVTTVPALHGVFTLTSAAADGMAAQTLLPNGDVFLRGPNGVAVFDPRSGLDTNAIWPPALQDAACVITLRSGDLLCMGSSGTDFSLYDPASGEVTPTGSMIANEQTPDVTMLVDGRVLFTGGDDGGSGFLTVAQIYDPATNRFTRAGSMHDAREDHVAILLGDGRVLVAGGDQGTSQDATILSSAEIFDPATGKFTAIRPMIAPQTDAQSVVLADGRVLLVGGMTLGKGGAAAVTASAQLYDPKTGKFSRTGSMASGRDALGIARLDDGRVLVTGGNDPAGNALTSAEIYDPATGTFSAAGSMMNPGGEDSVLLTDGRVLVSGGSGPPEIYWP